MEEKYMSFSDFCETLKQYFQLKEVVEKVTCPHCLIARAEELKESIESSFCDADRNFEKWCQGEECTFVSPESHKRIFLKVGKDAEVIYHFLAFCFEINTYHHVSESQKTYLAYLLSLK